MRTVAQVAGIGLVTAVGSVAIALSQAPWSAPGGDWRSSGLAQLDVKRIACDASLPDGPPPHALEQRLRTVTPRFMPCLSDVAEEPRGTLRLELTVDCTGELSRIEVADADGWPDDVVACTKRALSEARFPAHGRAGGYTFDLPVRYTASR